MPAKASSPAGPGKQAVIGIVAVVALIAAVVVIYKMWAASQVHVVKSFNLTPGSSEKMQAMKEKGQVPDEGASDNIDPSKARRN